MARLYVLFVIYILLFFCSWNLDSCHASDNGNNRTSDIPSLIHVGAVLDMNSPLGSMADLCIRMALSDFYLTHPKYMTRLELHVKNANTLLDANFAVLDLLNNEDVHAILGPEGETENIIIAELGEKVLVPIISFTTTSSIVSYTNNRYFVRATSDDAVQAKALAAVCQGFEWPAVVVLYEETSYCDQFLSHLNKAFQDVDIGVAYMIAVPTSAEDSYLSKELVNLTTRQTRVFLVHMSPSLGYRLFTLAKSLGIMSEGYAWIVSDSLSNFMSSMALDARNSMEGVLGVRPYVYLSKELQSFQQRWRTNMILEKPKDLMTKLNVYGLWAYDAVTALAIAVEKIGPLNSTSLYVNKTNKHSHTNLRISTVGPRILEELSTTKFNGLAGEFELVDGKLKQSAFEIFNVFGSGQKTVGFWTPDKGIIREISSDGRRTYSRSTKELKSIIWPGDSIAQPKGWAIPTTGILRVGVPWKQGFTEFVYSEIDHATNHTKATGFAIDIFLAALKVLPFPINYEFQLFNDTENSDWSYDEMLQEIPQNFDMVVGDTTIRAPRATYVEFSLPYSESGVILVVKNKKPSHIWIFIQPLRWDLWLAIIVACIIMGIVLHIMDYLTTSNNEDQINQAPEAEGDSRVIVEAPVNQEHEAENQIVIRNNGNQINQAPEGDSRVTDEAPINQAHEAENHIVIRNNGNQINQAPEGDSQVIDEAPINQAPKAENQIVIRNNGNQINQARKKRFGTVYLSPIAVLAFPESRMVSNNWSFLVLVFWMFMAFILMQAYTANFAAILTVDELKFAFSDDYYVGYQTGSFMKHFLTEQLHISASRLRNYTSAEEYHKAMSLGSKRGGIDAIFDETPYMKLFLKKYDSRYKMVGPTYRTGGFGFAFPIGSPLPAYFSKAILSVTQGPEITAIEQKNFGPGYSSQDPLSSTISQRTSSLTLYEFTGLFIIVGSVTVFALLAVLCSRTRQGRRLMSSVKYLIRSCCCIQFRNRAGKAKEQNGIPVEAGDRQNVVHHGADE